MVVDKTEMINGWFEAFAMAGQALGYRLADRSLLWDKPVDLNHSVFNTQDPTATAPITKVLKVAIPVHFRVEQDGQGTTYRAEPASIYVYGFFGPGAESQQQVCKPATLTTLEKMVKRGDENPPPNPTYLAYSSTWPTLAALSSTSSLLLGITLSRGALRAGQGPLILPKLFRLRQSSSTAKMPSLAFKSPLPANLQSISALGLSRALSYPGSQTTWMISPFLNARPAKRITG